MDSVALLALKAPRLADYLELDGITVRLIFLNLYTKWVLHPQNSEGRLHTNSRDLAFMQNLFRTPVYRPLFESSLF